MLDSFCCTILCATEWNCLAIAGYSKPELKVHEQHLLHKMRLTHICNFFVEKMHVYCTYIFMIYQINFSNLPRFTFFSGGRCKPTISQEQTEAAGFSQLQLQPGTVCSSKYSFHHSCFLSCFLYFFVFCRGFKILISAQSYIHESFI